MRKRSCLLSTFILTIVLAACANPTQTGPSMPPPTSAIEPTIQPSPTIPEPTITGPDTSSDRLTDQGLYRVSFENRLHPIEINQIHSWTLHVETVDGQSVADAVIRVDGGMPEHGHGLPTQPEVTQNLGDGDYLVEGLKFQMGGWWEVKFAISSEGQTDNITFNLILE